MSPVPVNPRRVFGVDFSAARDAGRHIWVCRAHPGADGIRIESVDRLHLLPGGASGRDEALRALVHKVVESPRSAWGLTFPFSLPGSIAVSLAPVVAGRAAGGGWDRILDAVAGLGDPEALRRRAAETTGGAGARRRTDEQAATPFAPCDPRVYKQTYHGMSGVLRPLRARAEVAVLPFDRLPPAEEAGHEKLAFNRPPAGRVPHIYVMEVHPAALLRALGHDRGAYRGSEAARTARRAELLRRLVADDLLRPPARSVRVRVAEDGGGGGLGAVLAAVAAWRGYRLADQRVLHDDPLFRSEGFVYA